MQPDGSYVQRDGGKDVDGAHQQMIKWVEGRFAEANRLRRRSARGPRGSHRRTNSERWVAVMRDRRWTMAAVAACCCRAASVRRSAR